MKQPAAQGPAPFVDEFAQLGSADTQGLLIDMDHLAAEGVARLREALVSASALNAITVAEKLPMRFAILAGQLHVPEAGITSALAADEDNAIIAMLFANGRMQEIGSKLTAWILLCGEPFQQRVQAVLAEAAGFEGGRQ
jgi:hypothetical protein